MSAPREELGDLRQKIDAIDEKIINLLIQRTLLVEEVGRRKANANTTSSFIRPGREASMVRNLVQKIEGHFPKEAVVAIWRQIISASLSVEHAMPLAAYRDKENEECYWLAREYFGSFLPLTTFDDMEQVVHQVASGKVAVGVIPYASIFSGDAAWWTDFEGLMASTDSPRIFACIPFLNNQQNPQIQAVAIAKVMPEPTGDDTSLLAVSVTGNVSQEHLAVALNTCGLALGNNFWHQEMPDNTRGFLFEVHGFITTESQPIKEFCEEFAANDIKINILGTYANPIKI